MLSCLVTPCKPFPSACLAYVVVLTVLLSGWTTCTAIVNFSSCPGAVPLPQIVSLSPDSVPSDAESVLLIVSGSGFVPQSQIMWNDSPLQTTFTDSHHLQTTITKDTLNSFGATAGSSAQISVMSEGSVVIAGCANGGGSTTLVLLIN
jgi:hypothetical protein